MSTHRMEYNNAADAWFGRTLGKVIRVEAATMEHIRQFEESAGLPPTRLNPAFWWSRRKGNGISWTFYAPEKNILEIILDASVEVLPENYRRAFPATEFTRIASHHFAIFSADIKGWATNAQFKALSDGYSHGDGPDYEIDYNLSAETAESED